MTIDEFKGVMSGADAAARIRAIEEVERSRGFGDVGADMSARIALCRVVSDGRGAGRAAVKRALARAATSGVTEAEQQAAHPGPASNIAEAAASGVTEAERQAARQALQAMSCKSSTSSSQVEGVAPPPPHLSTAPSRQPDTNSSAQVEGIEPPQLPAALSTNGAIDSALRRPRAAGEPRDTDEARERMKADLAELQRAYVVAHAQRACSWADPRGPLVEALAAPYCQKDALLRYAVAHLEGTVELGNDFFQDAAQTYAKTPDGYDAILGALIPPHFRELIRNQLTERAYSRGTNPTQAGDMSVYLKRLEMRRNAGHLGLGTGFSTLDRARIGVNGITIVAAPTACGKTSFALWLARHVIRSTQDYAVLYYLLDHSMTKDNLIDRLICMESNVSELDLSSNEPSGGQAEAVVEAIDRLRAEILPYIKIHEWNATDSHKPLTTAVMMRHRNELLAETGASKVLVIYDHLQKMPVTPLKEGGTGEETDPDLLRLTVLQDYQARTRTSAHPSGDPLLVLSEVRKERRRDGLTIEDIPGSTSQGYGTHAILLIEPHPSISTTGGIAPLKLRVAKVRGRQQVSVDLDFHYLTYQFRERPQTGSQPGPAVPAKTGGTRVRANNPFGGK